MSPRCFGVDVWCIVVRLVVVAFGFRVLCNVVFVCVWIVFVKVFLLMCTFVVFVLSRVGDPCFV